MPVYQVGDVLYASFAYKEGDDGKDRTVLVLVPDLPGNSALVCMITKKFNRFDKCVEITPQNMLIGEMDVWPSYARPYFVATIDNRDIRRRLGQLRPEFSDEVRDLLLKRILS